MLQCPPCPQTVDELDGLIYALTNEKFDKSPEEIERDLLEFREKLQKKGLSERAILTLGRLIDIC
jgi:hypothetical protein